MPPLHPAIVHLPISLMIVAFVADVISWRKNHSAARTFAWWSLLAATIGAALAIPLGYYDMNRASLEHETHDYVHVHLKIGWVLLVALSLLSIWRFQIHRRPEKRVGIGYLMAACLVLLLTLFQGWFGGELVFSHGAGVAVAEQGTEPANAAKKRLGIVTDALNKVPGFRGNKEHSEPEPHSHEHENR